MLDYFMKKNLGILFFISTLILITSCAKPKVVNVVVPGDNELNCEQLENSIAEAQKLKSDAEYAKDGTGGNVARFLLFWPAWAQTLHNADVAIVAANDRTYHLTTIMKKKKCDNVAEIESKISKNSYSNNLTYQLKELKKMYKSGDLTKEEYKKAKKKLLD